ncbi:copper-containing nitrite reductase [Geochorda subterranea]|uniref:Copper-containing nitrite reductase n=1 Tax=Geochorda subterranea TaxID=3109564 RepID=A0ABZ1BSG6_9FIRM|nr:copper-containing nitrite reductase [Limnochorda sp. LNt]WRP15709.1 copper-containing nitrite reductase [Limnochorda sp. LNt]
MLESKRRAHPRSTWVMRGAAASLLLAAAVAAVVVTAPWQGAAPGGAGDGAIAPAQAAAAPAPRGLAEVEALPTAPKSAPPHVPPPIDRKGPATLRVDLEAVETTMQLADGVEYTFWTFDGTVPGPMIRVREGDTVVVRVTNRDGSTAPHSIDLHAVTGTGGGAIYTQTMAGGATAFVFKALAPGLYVYHCATAPIPMHIANGMYGMILVEPADGLPPVDREYYVMQQEVYTAAPYGQKGLQTFDWQALWDEPPEYVVFNGRVGSLAGGSVLRARTGETVRIYFGVGGPNLTSSFHVIGEIFDRVYMLGSLTAPPLTDVQTVLVPPGGSVVVDFAVEVPGRYTLVDHALGRIHKGAIGELVVEGPERPDLFRPLR